MSMTDQGEYFRSRSYAIGYGDAVYVPNMRCLRDRYAASMKVFSRGVGEKYNPEYLSQ